VLAKASPKPPAKTQPSPAKSAEKAKKADTNAEKKKIAKTAPAKNGLSSQTGTGNVSSAGKGGHAGGGSNGSDFGWYGSMLHDRFYSAWIQPTANIATGTKISTLVKVRIEKDGRVSSFEIIKPSENVVVNESVAAIAKRVTEVDPPPAGLSNGDHYDVKINFELNADQGTAK
jgi:TonB family protein